jgi:hypothetical protein
VEASVEAGKPRIPALERPQVKSLGIATFLPLAVEAEKKTAARAVAKFVRPPPAEPRDFTLSRSIGGSHAALTLCSEVVVAGLLSRL